MCDFFSAIVTRDGRVLAHDLIDSHEEIIDVFGLKDGPLDHICRVEFLPDYADMTNLDKWTFKIDQPSPGWWTS